MKPSNVVLGNLGEGGWPLNQHKKQFYRHMVACDGLYGLRSKIRGRGGLEGTRVNFLYSVEHDWGQR